MEPSHRSRWKIYWIHESGLKQWNEPTLLQEETEEVEEKEPPKRRLTKTTDDDQWTGEVEEEPQVRKRLN